MAAAAPINYDDATKRLLNKLKTKYGIPERQMQQALPNFNPQEPDNVYTQADYDRMMSNVRGWKEHNPFYKVPRSDLTNMLRRAKVDSFLGFEPDEINTQAKKDNIKPKLQAELDRREGGQTGTVSTGGKRKTKKRRRKRKTKRKKRKTKKRRRKRKRKTKKKKRR